MIRPASLPGLAASFPFRHPASGGRAEAPPLEPPSSLIADSTPAASLPPCSSVRRPSWPVVGLLTQANAPCCQWAPSATTEPPSTLRPALLCAPGSAWLRPFSLASLPVPFARLPCPAWRPCLPLACSIHYGPVARPSMAPRPVPPFIAHTARSRLGIHASFIWQCGVICLIVQTGKKDAH